MGGSVMQLSDASAIIDSGTTLAYVPDKVYKRLMNAVCALSSSLFCYVFNLINDNKLLLLFHFYF